MVDRLAGGGKWFQPADSRSLSRRGRKHATCRLPFIGRRPAPRQIGLPRHIGRVLVPGPFPVGTAAVGEPDSRTALPYVLRCATRAVFAVRQKVGAHHCGEGPTAHLNWRRASTSYAGTLLRTKNARDDAEWAPPRAFYIVDKGHGVPAHDQALHMTATSFNPYSALIERDLRRKGNVDHRRPAFRRAPVAKRRSRATIENSVPSFPLQYPHPQKVGATGILSAGGLIRGQRREYWRVR